jgi:tRNA threonylcarbamoyl adenosine modification protein (Sua5/YciO/YrdC/YwlC family)
MLVDCSDPAQRADGIKEAVRSLKAGGLAVIPTDTVYGIAADAFDPHAVASLLATKGRGRDMPIPVLVGSWHTIEGLVDYLPADAHSLVRAFWPGGLTIVVRHAISLAWDLGDTDGTVAVRMPLHPVALEVLRETGPLAVSSANRSGQSAAATASEAMDQLGDDVSIYLDGGPCPDPVASTIVDLTGANPRLIRAGQLSVERLRSVVPDLEVPE